MGKLYLVGMGIVYARYPEKNIQMHRFNIRNNTVRDCDQDGKLLYEAEIPGIMPAVLEMLTRREESLAKVVKAQEFVRARQTRMAKVLADVLSSLG